MVWCCARRWKTSFTSSYSVRKAYLATLRSPRKRAITVPITESEDSSYSSDDCIEDSRKGDHSDDTRKRRGSEDGSFSSDESIVDRVQKAVSEDGLVSSEENEDDPIPLILKQRTKEWENLRQERLTASTFASALGFWGNYRRSELWAQKLGLRQPFAGNTATDWGIRREAAAIRKYEKFTGINIKYLAFHIYKQGDKTKDWIGGSPDGLIDGLDGDNGGILEVKCPYNQGKPEFSIPWNGIPYHYIPQLQGLMEILDRDWLDLFVWTMNGSAIYRVERNYEYWELIFDVLNDFWWGSVVPGRKALAAQKDVDVNVFKPILRHRLTPIAVKESKRLAKQALMVKKFLV